MGEYGAGPGELGLSATHSKADVWTFPLPASRMKGKRPHAVPLPAAAVAVLEAMPRRGSLYLHDGRHDVVRRVAQRR
jgi:hypothetical protein